MADTMQPLWDRIEEQGWKARIVGSDRVAELEEAICWRYECGLLDEALYREQLSSFSFAIPEDLPNARSIIILAIPVPQVRIIFHSRGARLPVIVPPTYSAYSVTTARVQRMLAAWLEPAGYRVAPPQLPLKTLAVRSGLAVYGRNNICYVPGMGSFLQLVGAFSDLPCAAPDGWQEPAILDRCSSCDACVRRCPTGAITRDRFLLHAEHCLTYHNESADEFPSWIHPSWHHCLIGCMRCQSVCPQNKAILGWLDDRAEFSEQETACLIRRVPLDQLPTETSAKLQDLALNENYGILCRNLSMLTSSQQTGASCPENEAGLDARSPRRHAAITGSAVCRNSG